MTSVTPAFNKHKLKAGTYVCDSGDKFTEAKSIWSV